MEAQAFCVFTAIFYLSGFRFQVGAVAPVYADDAKKTFGFRSDPGVDAIKYFCLSSGKCL
jgi:hypothetical protein